MANEIKYCDAFDEALVPFDLIGYEAVFQEAERIALPVKVGLGVSAPI